MFILAGAIAIPTVVKVPLAIGANNQLVTPYLPELSPVRATIAIRSLDTIDAVCRDIAQCQAGGMTADESDYITAWHAVQQAASSLR